MAIKGRVSQHMSQPRRNTLISSRVYHDIYKHMLLRVMPAVARSPAAPAAVTQQQHCMRPPTWPHKAMHPPILILSGSAYRDVVAMEVGQGGMVRWGWCCVE